MRIDGKQDAPAQQIAPSEARAQKTDFARVLGFQGEDVAQRNADQRAKGWRVIEAALAKQINTVGEGALKRYAAYDKLSSTIDRMRVRGNSRFTDPAMAAMYDSVETGAEANMRYLELQYQMTFMGQNWDCISNLMKARAEAVKNSLSGIQ